MRHVYAAFSLLLLFAACSPVGAPSATDTYTPVAVAPLSTPTPSPTPYQRTVEPAANVVSVRLSEATTSRVFAEIDVGNSAVIELYLNPSIHQITRRADGSVENASSRPWNDHAVTEMRVCTALEQPCAVEGDWRPFLSESGIPVEVGWLGPKEFWVTAQFRDRDGNVVPGLADAYGEPSALVQAAYTVVGTLDESTPIRDLPGPVQTAVIATRTSFPVQGSVEIENGGCCAGGTAGDVIDVDVAFASSSPFADVVEMRTLTGGLCFSEEEIATADWRPFSEEQAFPVHVMINWQGFYVTVQYRDAQGNLSRAYCDDISIEGHPATPSP